MLVFLDASDPYAAIELEDAVDDVPCDENELDGAGEVDDEPSLCGIHADPLGYLGDTDLEQSCEDEGAEHDGCEPGEDGEPSLGWTVDGVIQNTGSKICDAEQETAPAAPQRRTEIDRKPLTVENTYRRFLRGLPPDQAERVRKRARGGTDVIVVK